MPNFSLPDSVFQAACAAYATPFHLYDERGIRQTARRLKAAFGWNPGFREYFAVKALPTPAILRILGEEGCGLDCASETELRLADACGFAGEAILFSANDVPPAEFALARKLGAISEQARAAWPNWHQGVAVLLADGKLDGFSPVPLALISLWEPLIRLDADASAADAVQHWLHERSLCQAQDHFYWQGA